MMLSCKQASRLLSDRLVADGAMVMGIGQRLSLRLHLWMCAECRRFERQSSALQRALRRIDTDSGCCRHHPLPKPAQRRIAQALQQHQQDEGHHRL